MIEILKNKVGLFVFQIKDKEGKIIIRSDGYTQKTNCQKGISSIKRNSKNEDRFELKENCSRDWYLNVKAGNGKIIASGFPLSSKNEVKNILKKVMSITPTAEIKDLTKI